MSDDYQRKWQYFSQWPRPSLSSIPSSTSSPQEFKHASPAVASKKAVHDSASQPKKALNSTPTKDSHSSSSKSKGKPSKGRSSSFSKSPKLESSTPVDDIPEISLEMKLTHDRRVASLVRLVAQSVTPLIWTQNNEVGIQWNPIAGQARYRLVRSTYAWTPVTRSMMLPIIFDAREGDGAAHVTDKTTSRVLGQLVAMKSNLEALPSQSWTLAKCISVMTDAMKREKSIGFPPSISLDKDSRAFALSQFRDKAVGWVTSLGYGGMIVLQSWHYGAGDSLIWSPRSTLSSSITKDHQLSSTMLGTLVPIPTGPGFSFSIH
jgi:hypothetical protein